MKIPNEKTALLVKHRNTFVQVFLSWFSSCFNSGTLLYKSPLRKQSFLGHTCSMTQTAFCYQWGCFSALSSGRLQTHTTQEPRISVLWYPLTKISTVISNFWPSAPTFGTINVKGKNYFVWDTFVYAHLWASGIISMSTQVSDTQVLRRLKLYCYS